MYHNFIIYKQNLHIENLRAPSKEDAKNRFPDARAIFKVRERLGFRTVPRKLDK